MKTSKAAKALITIAVIVVLLLAGFLFRVDRFGFVAVDYVDCVYFNNQFYYSGWGEADRTPVEPALIGEKIGQVTFTLAENVHSTWYINRNGDAAFLVVGTEIYSVEADGAAIAVKIDGQYYRYEAKKG
jgi:hypothetical protein